MLHAQAHCAALDLMPTCTVLRMELHGEEGLALVDYALVGAVVGVGEELAPAGRHGVRADRVAVVLRGHVAAASALQPTGLIVTSVTVPGIKRG